MNEIKLFNRDGADLKLVNIDENLWKFTVDENHKYVLDFLRLGLGEDNKTIEMVDPSGGPYMTLGYKLNENLMISVIINIDNKILIATKEIGL